ncbi:MAG: lipopolysaccharide biosynthesis protein [Alphaproteobacteria bacterium]
MIQAARHLLARHSHVNWALADQALVSGTNFLTGILLARFLGLEEFGRFTLAWMAVQFVNSIQFALVSAPMMTIGPKQSADETPAYYGAVVAQAAAFAALSFAILWAGAWSSGAAFPGWRAASLALPLACAVFAFQMQDFLRRYFFTRGRAAAAFANDALRYLAQIAALIVVFAAAGLDSRGALWVIAACAAAATALGLATMGPLAWRGGTLRTVGVRHWNFARWLTASAVMHWLSGNLFIIAAGAFLGAAAVGALRAAQNLMAVTHILFQGLENVVPSRAAERLHRGGKAALVRYLRTVASLNVLATAVVAFVAAVAPVFWLELLYGAQFAEFGGVLQWYALIYVVMALTLPLRVGLRTLEDTKPIFVANVCSLGFSVLVCYWFVNTFGVFGALYGTFIMYAITQLVLWIGLRAALARVER